MATSLPLPTRSAAPKSKRSTRGSRSRPAITPTDRSSLFSRRQVSGSLRSADIAGRAVGLSDDIPFAFDAPLADHHKLVGRWVASLEDATKRYTRGGARRHIEQVFTKTVLEILGPFDMVKLRVGVARGDGNVPPALIIICDSVGQIDLDWIEVSNVLASATVGPIAPVSWQATAYKELGKPLGAVLPLFGYDELFEQVSMYYWDGQTTDVEAVRHQIEYLGVDPEEVDEEMLPSTMNARRPAWMLAENATALKNLPANLRDRIRRLRAAHEALAANRTAWSFNGQMFGTYFPDIEDQYRSNMPPVTLVPVAQFAREVDDACQGGMEYGFMDVAGICPMIDANVVEGWFASLRLGAEVLLAAQDLILLDPFSS